MCKVQAWRTVGIRGSHSLTQFIKMTDFSVEILPALQDNYMYLVCIYKAHIDRKYFTTFIIVNLSLHEYKYHSFRLLIMQRVKRLSSIRLIRNVCCQRLPTKPSIWNPFLPHTITGTMPAAMKSWPPNSAVPRRYKSTAVTIASVASPTKSNRTTKFN